MRYGTPPSLDDILELAETALSAIPQELRNLVGGTVMVVEEAPDDEILAEMVANGPDPDEVRAHAAARNEE